MTREKEFNQNQDPNQTIQRKTKPTKEEYRTDKNLQLQLWELEGPYQIHDSMQKRPPNRMGAPHPVDKFVYREFADRNRFSKKSGGWGKFHNQTREEFSEEFLGISINNLLEIAEWVDRHPNHPKAKYYIKNLF